MVDEILKDFNGDEITVGAWFIRAAAFGSSPYLKYGKVLKDDMTSIGVTGGWDGGKFNIDSKTGGIFYGN